MNFIKTIYYLGILTMMFSFVSCDDDDGNTPNQNTCSYQGFTFLDINNNTTTSIPEADLFTDFYYTSSNGPEVEIYKRTDAGNLNFTTTVVTLNGTGVGTLNYNGTTYTVNVICQRTGNAVGQEMRFDLTSSSIEGEFCVIIDDYH